MTAPMTAGTTGSPGPLVVLVLADGAGWEPALLAALDRERRTVVLKRCLDLEELLATAASGQAGAAVVPAATPGLDGPALAGLRDQGVRLVAVVDDARPDADAVRARLRALGVRSWVSAPQVAEVPSLLLAPEPPPSAPSPQLPGLPGTPPPSPAGVGGAPHAPGRVVAVWGPRGAPGRSLVAATLAAGLARRGRPVLLVDADPAGGSLAAQLGVLDDVSGLLAAARAAAGDTLDPAGLAAAARLIAPGWALLTGLPRAERWSEVRPGALTGIVGVARRHGDVVLDTGAVLEEVGAGAPGATGGLGGIGARTARHQLTAEALAAAQEVVVVGAADPVGLGRLARGLVELRDRVPGTPLRVVVNRVRPTLGWSERQIVDLLADVAAPLAPVHGPHLVPEDRAATDRALVRGTALHEAGDGPALRALESVLDAVLGVPPGVRPGAMRSGAARARTRTAGRARRR